MARFYITTAIDYPNGKPHLGHAYEKIITDTYARWQRMMGDQVFFCTGTDENGQKLAQSAKDAGLNTQTFVDQNSRGFREFCKRLNLSHDDFIRTTEPRHIQIVHQLWATLKDKGFITFGQYEGYYCLSCEAFYPENQAPDRKCPTHGIPLTFQKEDGYFFKMSSLESWIKDQIKSNPTSIQPESIRKEIMSRLEVEPLKDLSISRPNEGWGIPVPGDEKFVIYTWFDALINYYTATRQPAGREAFWPANMHVIGKDIAWFHCVIWPMMCHAAGIELPKEVYVHGMLLGEDGRKMSKSLGNVIDPAQVLEVLPVESFRFYLIKSVSSHQDGKVSYQEMIDRHNTELANDLGNLIMRVVKLALKRIEGTVQASTELHETSRARFNFTKTFTEMSEQMQNREHHLALESLWVKVRELNVFVNDRAPWKEKDPAAFQNAIYECLVGIYGIAHLLIPYMPQTAEKLLAALGPSEAPLPQIWQNLAKDFLGKPLQFHLKEPEMLFPKIDLKPSASV